MFPVLQDRLVVGLNTLVPTLASALGASSAPIRSAAGAAVACLVNSVEPSLLVQNFSHCVKQHDTRGKAVLVERLAAMVPGAALLLCCDDPWLAFSVCGGCCGDMRTARRCWSSGR